jgi:hypothetical protein
MKSLASYAGAALPRQLGRDMLSSHAGDGVTETTLVIARCGY